MCCMLRFIPLNLAKPFFSPKLFVTIGKGSLSTNFLRDNKKLCKINEKVVGKKRQAKIRPFKINASVHKLIERSVNEKGK